MSGLFFILGCMGVAVSAWEIGAGLSSVSVFMLLPVSVILALVGVVKGNQQ